MALDDCSSAGKLGGGDRVCEVSGVWPGQARSDGAALAPSSRLVCCLPVLPHSSTHCLTLGSVVTPRSRGEQGDGICARASG